MVAASLVRRKQIMNSGGPDPYAMKGVTGVIAPGLSSSPGTSTVCLFPCLFPYTIYLLTNYCSADEYPSGIMLLHNIVHTFITDYILP